MLTGMAIAGAAINVAIKKPLEDAYGVATGAVKSLIKKWNAAGVRDSIVQKIEDVELVRTIFRSELVRLSSFYYPSSVFDADDYKKTARLVEKLDELSGEGNVLLFGTVGQGKSMFMRHLCVSELREGRRIPIFAELRNVDEKLNVFKLVRQAMEMKGFIDIDDEALEFLLGNGGFSIFLDGFDEVKREFALPTYQEITKLCVRFPKTRWIISSRPGLIAGSLETIPGMKRLRLMQLTENDLSPFLVKQGLPDVHREKLLAAIRASSSDVKGILTTPLMVTLLKETFGVSANIPNNLHDFYEALFHVLAWRHDDIKDTYQRERATSLSNAELQEAFEAFSYLSKEFGVALSDSQFSTCAKEAAKLSGKSFTPEGLKSDLTGVVCLMAQDGLRTAFIHRSIQEFFAAFFIKGFTDSDLVEQFYKGIRRTKVANWLQELSFLEDIDHFRHLEYFVVPNMEELLSEIGYSKTGRVSLTIDSFMKYVERLSLHTFRPAASDQPNPKTFVGVCTDSPVYNQAVTGFVVYVFQNMPVMNVDQELVDNFKSRPEIEVLRVSAWLKVNKAKRDEIIGRARDYCARIDRDLTKHRKTLGARKDDVSRLFLGKKRD
ncbi:NACHT domain-containing protein [Burkholderia cenocepacia]|jgi:hypothetical protein|uniref:NACHT domain-containing protein n=2 Tax=Burkholderia cenocepacia TaxID=95486 RepID=UPI0004F8957A|nr:hypothetical protein [Burkholderia cenocepacia]AIO49007.1 NACHT domain protein [Burkholderia cepacia]ELW9527817.1 hypothetical protein [Burkholderia cenocepacia]KGB94908.1 NACHT domain protein [Burkholderia cepacia]MCG0578386.1 hypothetical protein [Burkholderia cenocepacia]MCW3524033.1 hypothetical protein [Burkholderia cenocepacia]